MFAPIFRETMFLKSEYKAMQIGQSSATFGAFC
jgi:hypothetical protein